MRFNPENDERVVIGVEVVSETGNYLFTVVLQYNANKKVSLASVVLEGTPIRQKVAFIGHSFTWGVNQAVHQIKWYYIGSTNGLV